MSYIRERFGVAGLIVAIVALVASLAGGAYAASGGLTGKQKKEVTNIAKQYAGKPGAKGDTGAKGDNGASGAKGDNGASGAKGDVGAPGANGISPIGTSFPGSKGGCPEGGVEFKGINTSFACNGKEGSPWTAGGVLPSEKTEAGAFSAIFTDKEAFVPVSFTIPLAAPLDAAHVKINAKGYNGEDEVGPEHEACPGTAEKPRAKAGFLCVYAGADNGTTKVAGIIDPSTEGFLAGAARSGAALFITDAGPGIIDGTWAVTAP